MSFQNLNLSPEIQTALKRLEFTAMTPIQEQSLPYILDGKNVIAQAATGSGKTLAFSLGILHRLKYDVFSPQCVILCPTRELSEQVAKTIRTLASAMKNIKVLTLTGGVPMRGQIHSLKHGAHIIVGTPGRILKLLSIDALDFGKCSYTVLDEADQMVDLGFLEDISAIFSYIPVSRQTLLFSATYPNSIQELSATLIQDPVFLNTIQTDDDKPNIEEIAYVTNEKLSALQSIIQIQNINSAIIFCNTKIGANELCDALNHIGIHAIALHGDMEQFDRNEAIIQFRNESVPFLIATDVAGRGIDIEGLECIINYDVPTQKERYTHRIGRTGRSGKSGIAITLIDDEQEHLFNDLGLSIQPKTVPTVSTAMQLQTSMQTISIDGGRKDKLRAGDIVGALIHECKLDKDEIGKIDQSDHLSYVAIPRSKAVDIYDKLRSSTIKGRKFKIWLLD